MSLNFEQLGLNILLAMIFSVLGFVLLFVGYRMFDAVTPGNLSRRIFDEGNVAAIMAGAFVIAVSIVIAASIHS